MAPRTDRGRVVSPHKGTAGLGARPLESTPVREAYADRNTTRSRLDERIVQTVMRLCSSIRLLAGFAGLGARQAIADHTLAMHDAVEAASWQPVTEVDELFDLVMHTLDARRGGR